MGGCSFSGKTSTKSDTVIKFGNNQNNHQRNNHSIPENNRHRQGHTSNNLNSYHDNQNNQTINNSTVKVLNKFQDMEEIDNQYIGEGIKRIKAYKSNLLYDQIDKLREEFYGMLIYIYYYTLYYFITIPRHQKRKNRILGDYKTSMYG
jgi:hypothetical protein